MNFQSIYSSTVDIKLRENLNHATQILQNLWYATLIHMLLTHVGPTYHWDMSGISQII